MNTSAPPVVILGCGYVGTRLAQSLLADGVQVRVCARRVALLEPLRALGAEVHYLEASRSHQFGPAMLGLDQPVVVYSIPGVRDLPQGEAVRRAASAAYKVHARAFVYLGSSAVYGRSEGNDNSEWVDEDSAVATNDPEAGMRLADEAGVQAVAQNGLRTVTLRLSAIYGPALSPTLPARGVRQRLRGGQYKLWDGGRYYFSRIYVDDLVRIIRRAADRVVSGQAQNLMYVVGDDYPCPQGEYAAWLAQHLKLPMPPSVDSHLSGPGQIIRGRRLSNARLRRELDMAMLYPSFREGEGQIDACEQSGTLPPLRLNGSESAKTEQSGAKPANPAQPPLPTLQTGLDFGVALGGQPLGVALLTLAPGQTLEPNPHTGAQTPTVYLVLSGQLAVVRAGERVDVGPRTLVPGQAMLHNASGAPVELIAIAPPR